MAKITYMPTGEDGDTTVVAGITFTAYQPVDIQDEGNADLIEKLASNAWFTDGDPDPVRKANWFTMRGAKQQAQAHIDHAARILADPASSDFAASLQEAANRILADARAEADAILAMANKMSSQISAANADKTAAADSVKPTLN